MDEARRYVPNVMVIIVSILIPPLLSFSPVNSPQSDDSILSQKVYGELVVLMSLVRNVCVKKCLPLSADRPDHLRLFRVYVSRKAAGKARAVLEGVGFNAPTIDACFSANPKSDEAAVQDGLAKWVEGKGIQPPTWSVLIQAMEYAEIAQQDIQGLKEKLSLLSMLFIIMLCMCACVYVCVWCDAFCVLCVVCLLYSVCHMYVHTV